MTDLAIIAMPLVFGLGGWLGYLAHRPRVVMCSARDLEPPPSVATVAEARDALRQFAELYERREIFDIGWDYVRLAEAMSRAEVQIAQAEKHPGDKREVAEAVGNVNRLRGRVEALNRRVAQLHTGEWPDP